MSETTSTTRATDEAARFRAFTALGLALTALMGGGVFATAFQWLTMRAFNDNGSEQFYWIGVAVGPLLMSVVALYLASTVTATDDALARPVARASLVIAVIAALGAVLLMLVTIDTP
jgi:hypothetical protein